MTSEPKLSVVVRCRNEAKSLRRLLTLLSTQRCDFEWELIVVDNESQDQTRDTAREFGARIVSIGRDEFTYGGALNRGIGSARAELVLLISAHILPVGRNFLSAAIEPFSDPQIAAAKGLGIGNRGQLETWDQPQDVQYGSASEQKERESRIGYKYYPTASCSVIRRSVWEQVKFDERMEAAEDKYWVSCVLARGYKVRSWSEALWLYTRKSSSRESLRKRSREYAAVYRMTGKLPLQFSEYLKRSAKTILLTPVVAASYLKNEILWNTVLITLPWRAKRKVRVGSMKEFDLPDSLRH